MLKEALITWSHSLYNTPLYFHISGIIFPSFVFTFTIDLVSILLLY